MKKKKFEKISKFLNFRILEEIEKNIFRDIWIWMFLSSIISSLIYYFMENKIMNTSPYHVHCYTTYASSYEPALYTYAYMLPTKP